MKSVTSPKGQAKFVNIQRADKKGKYSLAISLDPSTKEYSDFVEEFKALEQDFGKEFRNKPLAKPDKERNDDGEFIENGQHLVNFTASQFKPAIFDADGNQCPDLDIGWSSTIRVSFICKPYDATEDGGGKGIAKYIKGIQVIDLKEAGTTAESCGFEKEKGFSFKEWDKKESDGMTEEERKKAVENNNIRS